MNWEAIGAVGEILGAVTVVATIFYLSLQIRQNTRSQSIAIFESAMSGYNEIDYFIFGDVERASIIRRANVDFDSLNEDEIVVWNGMTRVYSNQLYKLFRLYEQGVFPESEWINTVSEAKQIFEVEVYTRFKETNHYYADLWKEMDQRKTSRISNWDWDFRKHEGRSSDA